MKKTESKKKRIVRGRDVVWESQGQGRTSVKGGKVVRLISPGESALEAVPGRLKGAIPRSKRNFKDIAQIERYLIEVFKDPEGKEIPPALYCTRASLVREVNIDHSGHPDTN